MQLPDFVPLLVIGSVLFIGVSTSCINAADLSVGSPKADKAASKITEPTLRELLDFASRPTNLNCTAWTDGCRSCAKNPDGVLCSNVGVACQSSEPSCTRH